MNVYVIVNHVYVYHYYYVYIYYVYHFMQPSTQSVLVKELIAGSLVAPTGSTVIWNESGTGGRYQLRVFLLTAPTGYTCLGNVAVEGHVDLPNYNYYRYGHLLHGIVMFIAYTLRTS